MLILDSGNYIWTTKINSAYVPTGRGLRRDNPPMLILRRDKKKKDEKHKISFRNVANNVIGNEHKPDGSKQLPRF